MKNIIKNTIKTVILLTVATACLTMAGCSKDEDDTPRALSIVIGNHANSRELNFNSSMLRETVSDVILNYGTISVVNLDGNPSVVACNSFDIKEQYKKAAKEKLESDAERKSLALLSALPSVKAEYDEVDDLDAISLAARSLGEMPEGTDKTIIILDTGISTTGVLNFQNNILNANPDDVVNQLKSRDALPNLTDFTVIWQQMGDVAGKQAELSNGQRRKLEDIWSSIITAAGGTFIKSEGLANNGSNTTGFPKVSAVKVPSESAITFTGQADVDLSQPLIVGEDYIGFQADTADYLDESSVRDVLKPIVKYMNDNCDFTLLLVGTTAGDGESDYNTKLSQNRASAVANTLADMGINTARLSTYGAGSINPWHVSGLGVGSEAACNRTCVMIDATSDVAQQLICR